MILYTSDKKRFITPTKSALQLLERLQEALIGDGQPQGYILINNDHSVSFCPSPNGKKMPLYLEDLLHANIKIYLPKYRYENKRIIRERDPQPPPYAHLRIDDGNAVITTNEAIGWLVNPKRLEDIFYEYVPAGSN